MVLQIRDNYYWHMFIAYTVPRGADPSRTDGYPQDRLFIQRYVLPVNMLCNENSYSNAEIISHGFKALERGNARRNADHRLGDLDRTCDSHRRNHHSGRLSEVGTFLMEPTWRTTVPCPDLVVLQTRKTSRLSMMLNFRRRSRIFSDDFPTLQEINDHDRSHSTTGSVTGPIPGMVFRPG